MSLPPHSLTKGESVSFKGFRLRKDLVDAHDGNSRYTVWRMGERKRGKGERKERDEIKEKKR